MTYNIPSSRENDWFTRDYRTIYRNANADTATNVTTAFTPSGTTTARPASAESNVIGSAATISYGQAHLATNHPCW